MNAQFVQRFSIFSRLQRPRALLWSERPYRQKLALAAWFSLVPISIMASVLAFFDSKQMVIGRVRQQTQWDAAEIRQSLTAWESTHLRYLQVLASTRQIMSMEAGVAQPLLKRAHQLFPYTSFSLVKASGESVTMVGPSFSLQPGGLFGTSVRTEIPDTLLMQPPQVTAPCLASTVPVHAPAGFPKRPLGHLASCLPTHRLGIAAAATIQLATAPKDQHNSITLLDFDERKRHGWMAMLVFPPGTFVELDPVENVRDQLAHLDERRVRRSPWHPFVRLALQSKGLSSFHELRVDGVDYFVAVNRGNYVHPVVVVVDQNTIFAPLRRFLFLALAGHVVAISVGTAVLLRICGQLSRPIDKAGEHLLAISHGDFGEPLPESNNDIGRLYRYVNQASQQLQHYLREELQHATLSAQLVEARRIQANFLIKDLPQTSTTELAALFQPAYEIGADWYDAFAHDSLTFMVVADVCDKGIPSALYMSVFRSLLRNSLQQECLLHAGDPALTLTAAVAKVNAYMAANHGETGMFATVFVAAFDAATNQLHYIVAGHEQPLLLNGQSFEALQLGGPAVGIFDGATFQAFSHPFPPNSVLLAFTDGLPDARNPDAVGFGSERTQRILLEQTSSAWTAAGLIARLHQAVTSYMDGQEQFDDLTLLTLKALPSSTPHG
jgi:serine phosphatase RsbU (regulator of sigma subunit)